MKAIFSQLSMFILIALTLFTLSGCGQSGVLYLPEHSDTIDKNKAQAEQGTGNAIEPSQKPSKER